MTVKIQGQNGRGNIKGKILTMYIQQKTYTKTFACIRQNWITLYLDRTCTHQTYNSAVIYHVIRKYMKLYLLSIHGITYRKFNMHIPCLVKKGLMSNKYIFNTVVCFFLNKITIFTVNQGLITVGLWKCELCEKHQKKNEQRNCFNLLKD